MTYKVLLSLVLCFSAAQSALADTVFSGYWHLAGQGERIYLNDPPFDEPRLFMLSCTEIVDGQYAEFAVTTDQNSVIAKIGEGTSAFVSARQISLTQSRPGQPKSCTWEIRNTQTVPFEQFTWSAPVQKQLLLGHFQEPTEFVFSFESKGSGCGDPKLTLTVDGKTVDTPAGQPQFFAPSSSFIGKGKTISMLALGTCPASELITGRFAITGTASQ
ncbi:hypothetical protein [Roseibium marinum]|uniref:Uncharacterized protein n=1 Tax=Roseibium marinum TaxID=281252 RepID=A0A2S3V4F8_9HYPH|nr:hypothetical protein [Roseibium marinum]POF34663.1 hypothetical protein CLV41_1011121 [Roseibium marinum]